MVARLAGTRGVKHQTAPADIIATITSLGANADLEMVLIPVTFTNQH